MATPRFDTLDNLRRRLAVRLGFGSQADMIALQSPILTDFLQSAQQYLWREVTWRHLRKIHFETLGVGQRVLDLPDDAGIASIEQVLVKSGTEWREVKAGLPTRSDETGVPMRYELNAEEFGEAQLSFYPVPDVAVAMAIEYTAEPARFTQNTDRASVPDDLIFLHALVNAKAHYRQPDVQAANGQLERGLQKAREANFGVDDSRFFRAHGINNDRDYI